MSQAQTRIENIIRDIQRREFSCRVQNLPQGISCGFRAHFASEIKKHEKSHSDSLKKNKKTNSRQYEMATNDLKALRIELGLDIDQEEKKNYTAIVSTNGEVSYVETNTIFDMVETIANQTQVCPFETIIIFNRINVQNLFKLCVYNS